MKALQPGEQQGARARVETGNAFLRALVDREFEELEAMLAPMVRFRGLITSGPFEEHSPADAVGRFRAWYGDAERIDVLLTNVTSVADRFRVSYQLLVHGPTPAGDGIHVIEQHVFGNGDETGITSLDLLCSGFRLPSAQAQGVEGSAPEVDR